MGFSRQGYWSELPFPSPGELPNPGIEPRSPTLEADALPAEPRGKTFFAKVFSVKVFGLNSVSPCQATRELRILMSLVLKNPPANAGDITDPGSTPGPGRSPEEGNGNPLQCSCLKNPLDRRASWATVCRVTKGQTALSV